MEQAAPHPHLAHSEFGLHTPLHLKKENFLSPDPEPVLNMVKR